ncbi:response regulator receiver protein [Halovenus sp. HT40]|uniref:response regulator receiver protein n=1 Tax=Halovenus sp. HT40 TaxID=3126691 RepID=UPI00300E91EE
MDESDATVAVFEDNKTRAELYALWLEAYDVRVASSKQTAQKHVDSGLAVAVVNEEFADGAAETLVEIIRAESQLCRVLAIRPRSASFPEFESESHLTKPVFEEELQEHVDQLLCRRNYHQALQLYYRARMTLVARERAEPAEDEEIQRLRETATTLQSRLEQYRERLSDDDVAAVMRALTLDAERTESKEDVDSKYWPDRCPNCKEEWADSENAGTLKRIAAYVWRCTQCGNVIMENDPSHQQTHVYKQ